MGELIRLGRIPLIVVDEVSYIPFEPEAANLFFRFISGRYEHTRVIMTSNKLFGRWGAAFDDTVAAAMIDCLVHHAKAISLKGDSYRMRGRNLGRVPAANTGEGPTSTDAAEATFIRRHWLTIQPSSTQKRCRRICTS
ncbi:hypothetical protein GCM10022206_84590 [Streptomyces chiangmaiensis]